jgi:hypothetical protein
MSDHLLLAHKEIARLISEDKRLRALNAEHETRAILDRNTIIKLDAINAELMRCLRWIEDHSNDPAVILEANMVLAKAKETI